MATWLIVVSIVGGVFALIVLAVMGRFLGLWIQSVVSGAPVGILDLFMMRLRKVAPAVIVLNRISAKKAGLELSAAQLVGFCVVGSAVERGGHN